jgi:hypothetical protein
MDSIYVVQYRGKRIFLRNDGRIWFQASAAILMTSAHVWDDTRSRFVIAYHTVQVIVSRVKGHSPWLLTLENGTDKLSLNFGKEKITTRRRVIPQKNADLNRRICLPSVLNFLFSTASKLQVKETGCTSTEYNTDNISYNASCENGVKIWQVYRPGTHDLKQGYQRLCTSSVPWAIIYKYSQTHS